MKHLPELITGDKEAWIDIALESRKNNVGELRNLREDLIEAYNSYDKLIDEHTKPLEESVFLEEGELLVDYGPRNSYRMPSYHRADVSATWYSSKTKQVKDVETGKMLTQKKRYTYNWNFSVFNLYNRANPYFIYFDSEGDFTQGTLDVGAFQVSLFPILPSVTWNFSF